MAELLLKGQASGKWQVGDVVCAFNDRRIGAVHASHICHVMKTPLTYDGLRQSNSLADKMQSITYEYKFSRDGDYCIREDKNGNKEILGQTPNDRNEYIYVDLFIARRLQHPRHRIFGKAGSEYWYGGNQDWSVAVVDKIWEMIETETTLRRVDYVDWPRGTSEVPPMFYRCVTDDFSDQYAKWLVREGINGRRRAMCFPRLPSYIDLDIDRAA